MTQPTPPQLLVWNEELLRTVAEHMNSKQAVAVALLPRFGLEIRVDGQQFQVAVTELPTGHDIRLARDVAAGIAQAMGQLVEQIDGHLKKEGIAHEGPEIKIS